LALAVPGALRLLPTWVLVLERPEARHLLAFLPLLMVAALAGLEQVLMSALLVVAAAGRVVLVLLRPLGQTAR
jgi:hypothetical protein